MEAYHLPVLLHESVDGLKLESDNVVLDLTFGGGGHSSEILSHLSDGRLYGFDQDQDAQKNIPEDERFTFVNSNFKFLKQFVRYYGEEGVDAVLADLGVSSHHFDTEGRGFSHRLDEALDMRMNQNAGKSAAEVIAELSEEELADIFYYFGEIRNARKLAAEVVLERSVGGIKTTGDLKRVAERCTPQKNLMKYLAQTFQALRIYVNDEMEVLRSMLEQVHDVLKPGGRLAVITYHSLEDRLVKNYFKSGNFEGKVEKDFYGNVSSPFVPVNKRVIVPNEDELKRNSRSRSAKLRIVEKK